MPSVEVVHWNPEFPRFDVRVLRRIPMRRAKNNFGDLLGPIIVGSLTPSGAVPLADRRLLAVGSILQFARDDDVVWGAGVNGKVPLADHQYSRLDVRAVRGPRTATFLRRHFDIDVPEVFGDPALLLPVLRPDLVRLSRRRTHALTIIPNLNEFRRGPHVQSPRSAVDRVLRRIVTSELVVGSSLHAVIVAEAFGVPARLVRSSAEPEFKYLDYFEGTGRFDQPIFDDVRSALAASDLPPLRWDPAALLRSFPADLWMVDHESEQPVAPSAE